MLVVHLNLSKLMPHDVNSVSVVSVEGNTLSIPSASRVHIGTYYCIASNGVPPTKSKSIALKVQFPPMVWISNQLEMTPVGDNATLICNTESFPPAIHYWTYSNGSAVAIGGHNSKFFMEESVEKLTTTVRLKIVNVQNGDFGRYVCVAKNSLGAQDGVITLEGIQRHRFEVIST